MSITILTMCNLTCKVFCSKQAVVRLFTQSFVLTNNFLLSEISNYQEGVAYDHVI